MFCAEILYWIQQMEYVRFNRKTVKQKTLSCSAKPLTVVYVSLAQSLHHALSAGGGSNTAIRIL